MCCNAQDTLNFDVRDPSFADPFVQSRASLADNSVGGGAPAPAQGKPVLTFVTGNAKKLAEVRQILAAQAVGASGELPYEVASQKIDLPELQGEPAETAAEKCRLAALEVRWVCKGSAPTLLASRRCLFQTAK